MSEILLYYKRPDPTTWVYLSSFLTIGLFFVFHRFWSIRNLDIALLILLAPGLLMVHEGRRRQLMESEVLARQLQQQQRSRDEAVVGSMSSVVKALPIFALVHADPPEAAGSSQASTAASDSPEPVLADSESTAREPSPQANSPDGSERGDSAAVGTANMEPEESASVSDPDFTSADIRRWGYMYLLLIQSFLLVRLMLDPLMVRRPLLDPNLTTGGLNFIGISLFIFMMANVVASNPRNQVTQGAELGPGYALMRMLPHIPTRPVTEQPGGVLPPTSEELSPSQTRLATIAKVLAILAHLAIVSGIVLISNRHFSNLRAGVGCAMLYLMLPYTAQYTGRVDHALPAALLLWAVLNYRRPFIAGIFLGLAGGLVYYPLFLLPLWFSFYWQRGARNFAIGTIAMLALLMIALSFDDSAKLTEHLRHMFGLLNPNRRAGELRGLWELGWNPYWRLPVIVAYVILAAFFAIWPAQKNLGTLLSGSAALMVAAQLWHGESGGIYIAWFLPLLLLTIFRPNLQDRVATKVVASRKPIHGSSSELEAV